MISTSVKAEMRMPRLGVARSERYCRDYQASAVKGAASEHVKGGRDQAIENEKIQVGKSWSGTKERRSDKAYPR